ncbi:hypothetical protein, partial [Brevibacillus laterosporus]
SGKKVVETEKNTYDPTTRQLLTQQNNDTKISYTYDGFLRPTSMTTFGRTYEQRYEDEDDTPDSIVYPDGTATHTPMMSWDASYPLNIQEWAKSPMSTIHPQQGIPCMSSIQTVPKSRKASTHLVRQQTCSISKPTPKHGQSKINLTALEILLKQALRTVNGGNIVIIVLLLLILDN